MGNLSGLNIGLLVFFACITNCVVSLPLATTINCEIGTTVQLGEIDELYFGDLETFPNVPDVELVLEASCPGCAEFLELIPGVTHTTIRTKKPLDSEALRDANGVLSYQINCAVVANGRILTVRDINDNAPVFDKEEYRARIPETFPVGQPVVQVTAVDIDVSPTFSYITYSIEPPSTTFEISSDGQITLIESLDYTIFNQYNITVKAQDGGGLSNETRVLIDIIDMLSPQFEHDAYESSIPENQVGVLEVLPEPIKASSNYTVIYTISDVSPSVFWPSFSVDQSTGVVTVLTELDFEEIKDSITLHIKASLEIDSTRTANTTLKVHVEDVNEAPVFSVKLYTAEIFSVAQSHSHVVQVKATDPDVQESEKLQYSLVEPSSMFAVEPSSGLVYVLSVEGQSENVTLHVKATDPDGLYDTTKVEVSIKESDSKDVVVISLNQDLGTVQNRTTEMEEALERALGWSMTIISVSSSRQGSVLSQTPHIHSVQRENVTPRTFVSFIATEINGTEVIPKDTVETKLVDAKENVVEEMEQVFGEGFQFDIVDDGGSAGAPVTPIVLGTVIPLVLIAAGFSIYVVHRKKNIKPQDSMRRLVLNEFHSVEHEIGNAFDLIDSDSAGQQSVPADNQSMDKNPEFADNQSMDKNPEFADNQSMDKNPELADNQSMDKNPEFADNQSMDKNPEFTDNQSMDKNPEFELMEVSE